MRARLEPTPRQRAIWTVVAIALLFWGLAGDRVRQLVAVAGFFLILYAAGGGRLPWKVRAKDYLVYIAIALLLVAAMIVYTLYLIRFG